MGFQIRSLLPCFGSRLETFRIGVQAITMAWLPNPIACDVCGAVKQASNHWYYAAIMDKSHAHAAFSVWPWDNLAEDRSQGQFVHLCGQDCAIRKLAEFLNGCTPEAAKVAP